jgi:hypothetical protein
LFDHILSAREPSLFDLQFVTMEDTEDYNNDNILPDLHPMIIMKKTTSYLFINIIDERILPDP